MRIAHATRELDALIGSVLVPTMGALHEGHAALIRQGVRLARERGLVGCVVTIFVNPTQFNDPADFARYPKTLDADLAICRAEGAAGVFAPDVREVYPHGAAPHALAQAHIPAVAYEPGLEDAHRPGHFAGVCQVVRRLFDLCRPRAAIFGEKDWQQLQVIRAMEATTSDAVEIVAGLTVRDPDGLALSSRNRFLSPADRQRGLAIPRAIAAAGREATVQAGESTLARLLSESGIAPDYAVIRDAATLLPVPSGARAAAVRATAGPRYRTLVAAPVGPVRLIDNAPWPSHA